MEGAVYFAWTIPTSVDARLDPRQRLYWAAMDGYYRSPYRPGNPFTALVRHTPPGTRALVIVCAGVYLMQLLVYFTSPPALGAELIYTLGLVPARFVRGFVFQAVTYLFLHGSLGHLGFNMFTLWMFGSEIERLWGTRRYLTYYGICGIGAALCTVAVGWNAEIPTIGASGAILGLVLAYGMLFPNRTILLWFVIPLSARWLVILIVVTQILFYSSFVSSNIAVVAHLGGMLFGYLYLKKVWRIRNFVDEIRWRVRRRRFRVMRRGGNGDPGSFPFH